VRYLGLAFLAVGAIAMLAGIGLAFGSDHLRVELIGAVVEGIGAVVLVLGLHVAIDGWWSRP